MTQNEISQLRACLERWDQQTKARDFAEVLSERAEVLTSLIAAARVVVRSDEPGCVECARLRNDIQELTCGDPRLVCPDCRPDKQSVPACGELSVWGGTEILSCGLPAGHSGHHEFS